MGGMPFHLEKGCMGLRFDYLCRSPLVRQFLWQQLQPAGSNPFLIAQNITVAGITFNVLNDSKTSFTAKLDPLEANDAGRFDGEERRSSSEYTSDQTALLPLNKDTSGNRAAFVGYWTNKQSTCANIVPDARAAMIEALEAVTPGPPDFGLPTLPRPRMDFWWDCTLQDGECPMVRCSLESPRVARVLFITDHESAVAPRDMWMSERATAD